MTDAFAELGCAPRPWLDPVEIKTRYQTLARQSDRLAELNAARKILESPASRLRHLAAISFPEPVPFAQPAPNWAIFETIGTFCKDVREWRQIEGTTRLEQAVQLATTNRLRSQVPDKRDLLTSERTRLERQTRSLDSTWPQVEPSALLALAEEWTFWSRWNDSLHEAAALLDGA